VAIQEWQPDVSGLFATATAYVQPTIERERLRLDGQEREVWCAEGIPGAVLEALAWEKPTIGTAVGGIPEVLEHERTGLLVPPEDPEALAAAILHLYGSSELQRRLGAAGRRLVLERFTRNDFVEGVVHVYDELFEC
jgi:glycosyltransferase involved in cell wall biosynthesis